MLFHRLQVLRSRLSRIISLKALSLRMATFLPCAHMFFPLCVCVLISSYEAGNLGHRTCPNELSFNQVTFVDLRRAPISGSAGLGPQSSCLHLRSAGSPYIQHHARLFRSCFQRSFLCIQSPSEILETRFSASKFFRTQISLMMTDF